VYSQAGDPHNFINHTGSIGHTLHGVTNQWSIQAIIGLQRVTRSCSPGAMAGTKTK